MPKTPEDVLSNPPDWLVQEIATMQRTENQVYASDVSKYMTALGNWKAANTINQQNGTPITPFTIAKPQRVVVYAKQGSDAATALGVAGNYLDDPDSHLPDAVLPPPPQIQASSAILGSGSSNMGGSDPMINAKLDRILRILMVLCPGVN